MLGPVAGARRIVIVDDNDKVRAAVRALLGSEGFDMVAETADDDAAVDLVVATQPDAVLLDWLFEGKPRGALVLASLRRWAPGVPVVVYTAYPDQATSPAGRLGAAYVATKEIGRSAELAGVLRAVIDRWAEGRPSVTGDARGEEVPGHVGGHANTDEAQLERTAATAERERVDSQWSRSPALRPLDDEGGTDGL